MADELPPYVVADERTTLLALLQYKRESVARKAEGLSEEDARSSPVPSGTSLLWLIKHLSFAETIWVRWRFAGEDIGVVDNELRPEDTVATVLATYRADWAKVDAVIAAADLDDTTPDESDRPKVTLRWIVMHLLEETARHAGHADILRELIDGQTGR